ncbi:hypothetical protein Naga_100240g4 [Nannochloropsis gaditana]|uniref:Uncharacterized protein n=1 Tax=Nannochloropsis gaditana TaxID=72520 RepID=W7TP72_9STRA|nr:hypothetical protein Naga_100240g4 [Nannochloropsis gaditana]
MTSHTKDLGPGCALPGPRLGLLHPPARGSLSLPNSTDASQGHCHDPSKSHDSTSSNRLGVTSVRSFANGRALGGPAGLSAATAAFFYPKQKAAASDTGGNGGNKGDNRGDVDEEVVIIPSIQTGRPEAEGDSGTGKEPRLLDTRSAAPGTTDAPGTSVGSPEPIAAQTRAGCASIPSEPGAVAGQASVLSPPSSASLRPPPPAEVGTEGSGPEREGGREGGREEGGAPAVKRDVNEVVEGRASSQVGNTADAGAAIQPADRTEEECVLVSDGFNPEKERPTEDEKGEGEEEDEAREAQGGEAGGRTSLSSPPLGKMLVEILSPQVAHPTDIKAADPPTSLAKHVPPAESLPPSTSYGPAVVSAGAKKKQQSSLMHYWGRKGRNTAPPAGREELGFRSGIVWLMLLARSSSTQVYAFINHFVTVCSHKVQETSKVAFKKALGKLSWKESEILTYMCKRGGNAKEGRGGQ